MGLFSDFLKVSISTVALLLPTDGRSESFDFLNSFVGLLPDCRVNEDTSSLIEASRQSVFVAISDFGADIEMEHAKRTCATASGDARAEVVHKQLLDCRTKQNVFLQCRSYVLCRSENYDFASQVTGSCRSFAAGIDTASVELTRALHTDQSKNWSIANLLFSAVYFQKDLIPERYEDSLLRWMSSVDLSMPTSTRSLLIALGIVLQRPNSVNDIEVQRIVSYAKNLDAGNPQPYVEPLEVSRLSNASLERIVLELYLNTIPDSWMLPQ